MRHAVWRSGLFLHVGLFHGRMELGDETLTPLT